MTSRTQSRDPLQQERDADWRSSPFVVSYPNHGDRGRMRGSSVHPTGTFHRPTCGVLSPETRAMASRPAHVYRTSAADMQGTLDRIGIGNVFRFCKKCCSDMTLTGRNLVRASSPKTEQRFTLMIRTTGKYDPKATANFVRQALAKFGFDDVIIAPQA